MLLQCWCAVPHGGWRRVTVQGCSTARLLLVVLTIECSGTRAARPGWDPRGFGRTFRRSRTKAASPRRLVCGDTVGTVVLTLGFPFRDVSETWLLPALPEAARESAPGCRPVPVEVALI